MIPKVLHYCWFGRGEKDSTTQKCIASWYKYCHDYQIIEWNEDNFNINSNTFVQEAYEAKKWAFVSDYVRLYVLYRYGGIYLDADVELLKNFDDLLDLGDAVTSYQECYIPAAVMLAQKNNPWIGFLLSYYDNRHFRKEDGTLDIVQNDKIITVHTIQKLGFKMGDSHITLGNVCILPSVYFAPYKKTHQQKMSNYDIYKIDKNKTYAIHHGNGSWSEGNSGVLDKLKLILFRIARKILPEKFYLGLKWRIIKKQLGL